MIGLLTAPPALAAGDQPRITIAMLPAGTSVAELTAALPDAAPGVLSAGLGQIPASQTYLDIGQGARLSGSLYDERVPPLYVTGNRVSARRWQEVLVRAEAAPADLRPGLLATTLANAGIPITAAPLAGSPALIAVEEGGRVQRTTRCEPGACPGVSVNSMLTNEMPNLGARVREGSGDLLIAIERPPTERDLLAIAIVGEGFSGAGNLTSPSTRMDGFVLATDLLPTILARYGIAVPEGVSGRVIETGGGEVDPAAVVALEQRLAAITDRRWGVLAVNVFVWVAVTLIVIVAFRRRAAQALVLLATATAWVPASLLLTAALEPTALAERLVVGLGAPLLALLTFLALRRPLRDRAPYGAFGLAAGVSIAVSAADVLAGSPFTSLSLLGPNPGFGVRFYGIGNELEATLGALLLLGTGAAVTAFQPQNAGRVLAIAISLATLAAVLVFAPGRFGADVGAAITFPAGAAVAVIVALRLGTRRSIAVLAAPALAVAALVGIDLVLGGDAHLSRSVLQAGGLDELGDVLERRITLGANSFTRYWDSPFFIAAVVGLAVGIYFRSRIAVWFEGRPAASAAVIGAMAATVVGTLANDSAALLLMVGTGYIAAFCGLAWAVAAGPDGRSPR